MKKLIHGVAFISLLIGIAHAAPTVFIPIGSGNQVIAVDAATDRIIATYPGVDNPHGLVATPDGEYLVAGSLVETPLPAGTPADSPNSKLFLVHPGHGHVMATIPVSGWTHHQAITPDGRYVISTHPTRGGISAVDLQKNVVYKTVKTGPSPNYTLITRDGKFAYVSNTGNNTLSEIDLGNWRITRTLDSGPSPEHLVFSNDQKTIFVANARAGTVSSVSVADGKVQRADSIGKSIHGLDMGDDGKTLFATSVQEDKLVAIDSATGAQRMITLSPGPYHLGVIPKTGKLYVSSRKQPMIWVLDQKTLKTIHTIQFPAGEGHQIAVVK